MKQSIVLGLGLNFSPQTISNIINMNELRGIEESMGDSL
jgi:hypothetical protein